MGLADPEEESDIWVLELTGIQNVYGLEGCLEALETGRALGDLYWEVPSSLWGTLEGGLLKGIGKSQRRVCHLGTDLRKQSALVEVIIVRLVP